MLSFTKSKIKKTVFLVFFIITTVVLNAGCGTENEKSSDARSSRTRDSLEMMLYTMGALDSVGLLPRKLDVPVTSGETPYAFLVNVDEMSIGLLIGFSGFTAQEIDQSANQIIPFLNSILEETLGASVSVFTPEQLSVFDTGDAQSVQSLVLNNLLSGMDFYSRCYITKVDGPQDSNIRMDFYGWASSSLQDGQFLIRLQFEEAMFNQLLQLS